MPSVSSVEVRLKANAPACVLDAGLALSPGGLLLAIRLAREWPVWLVRSMWPLIDSNRLYAERPHLLVEAGEAKAPVDDLIVALSDWHDAWQRDRFGNIHWPGDHRHESDFPEDADDHLLPRFEALTSGLAGDGDEARWSWQRECAREALALAAALQTRPTVIVAACEGDAPPLVVRMWEQHQAAPCPPLDAAGPMNGHAPLSLPPGLRVGLPPLLDGRLTLAAVHVAAPRALALAGNSDDDELRDHGALGNDGNAAAPWKGAMLSWHRLV